MTRIRQLANCLDAIDRERREAGMVSADPLDRANAALEIFTAAGVRPSNREAQRIIALRLASPKRAGVGHVIAAQADAGHLPLFVATNEPVLL